MSDRLSDAEVNGWADHFTNTRSKHLRTINALAREVQERRRQDEVWRKDLSHRPCISEHPEPQCQCCYDVRVQAARDAEREALLDQAAAYVAGYRNLNYSPTVVLADDGATPMIPVPTK